MNKVWTKERAWAWYNARPWMRGCNFMGSDCVNILDQWQEYGFEERLKTADEELALAAQTGFNTVRLIPDFTVWEQEHDGFMERFDRYLELIKKHGISAIVVLESDCVPPKNEFWEPSRLGPQSFDIGYHGGKKFSQNAKFEGMGYHLLDEPESAKKQYQWVGEMIERHKNDSRIAIWDLYNEAGNCGRDGVTLPHLKTIFGIAREIDPIQPLTSCTWRISPDRRIEIPEVERYCIENSDLVSYHNYGSYEANIGIIKRLKEYGRPIVNTEWLARVLHNTVQELFPLFYLEKIGCINWGFVAGKFQTFEPWESVWQNFEQNPGLDVDFTKWFHDLYRPSHHPYDPKEIEMIRRYSAMADEDFRREHEGS